MRETVVEYVEILGYPFVAFWSFLESSLILPFSPGDILFASIVVGIFVEDIQSYIAIVIALTVSTIIGNVFVYFMSLRYGRNGLEWVFNKGGIPLSYINKIENIFEKQGNLIVLWGRFIPILRAYISVAAGLAQMKFRPYLVYTTIGTVSFNIIFVYLVWEGTELIEYYQHNGIPFMVAGTSFEVSPGPIIFLTLVILGILVSTKSKLTMYID